MTHKPLFIAVLLCCIAAGATGAILGIDFGTEWIKVAQLRGRTGDIILNEHSSRKTPAAFTFKDNILLFGTDAKNLETKQPEITYKHLWPMVGYPHGDSVVEAQRKLHAYELEDLEGGYAINVPGLNATLPVEAMVGIIMGYIRELANKHVGHTTKDCVITTPPFWTHHQRQALLDAAKIAGFNVLSLLNQPTALGVNFALARKELEGENNVIFYDMGASTTTASIINIKVNRTSSTPVSTVRVVDFSFIENLGGRDFDHRIADHIVRDVKTKKNLDVSPSGNKRAFAKILKESIKIKEVLSANIETGISIEGLVGDYDYRGHITRAQFEEASADLLDRVAGPLAKLFEDNEEIPRESVQYIELFGGGVRVPKIQQRLIEYLGRDLDKHVNGDEAAVMGAAFYAALQSPLYRISGIKARDSTPFQVIIDAKSSNGTIDQKSEIVPVGVRFGYKKTLTVSTEEDLTLDANYGKSGKLADEFRVKEKGHIGSWKVLVDTAIAKYNYSKTEGAQVHVHFRLNSNGIFELDKAEAELTVYTVPTKAKKTTKKSTTEETTEKKGEEKEETVEAAETKTDADTESTTEEEQAAPVKRIQRVPLTFYSTYTPGLKHSTFKQVEKGLQAIRTLIEAKRAKEKSKSTLESYIYDMRDKVESHDEFRRFSNEAQREEFSAALSAAGEWLYDDGDDAETSAYQDKLSSLKALGDAIYHRIKEATDRPSMLLKVYKAMNNTNSQLANITQRREVKQEEVDSYLEQCNDLKNWMQGKLEEQEKQDLWDEPVVTSDQVWGRWTAVELKAKQLLRRALKKVSKPKIIVDGNSDIPEDFIKFGENGEIPENFKFENVKFSKDGTVEDEKPEAAQSEEKTVEAETTGGEEKVHLEEEPVVEADTRATPEGKATQDARDEL
ncbi:hypothetical protein PROFUN_10964 [Planoprotostelium fungivorum]|uniref:Uncharacterized protein n=1 Tax=Planoprotostelium fungivorum TaxID=1890364 RepID=A0A2P6NBU2_9EUKA|nr:hypothetical protein PROFUN_10964 [Planoprotostelium fungivorum]